LLPDLDLPQSQKRSRRFADKRLDAFPTCLVASGAGFLLNLEPSLEGISYFGAGFIIGLQLLLGSSVKTVHNLSSSSTPIVRFFYTLNP
jgi:hypothetical protein